MYKQVYMKNFSVLAESFPFLTVNIFCHSREKLRNHCRWLKIASFSACIF